MKRFFSIFMLLLMVPFAVFADGTATAELFDVNGRLLLRQPLNPGVQPIATEKLAKGIYFLKLNSRQGSDIRKVVLQ